LLNLGGTPSDTLAIVRQQAGELKVAEAGLGEIVIPWISPNSGKIEAYTWPRPDGTIGSQERILSGNGFKPLDPVPVSSIFRSR
jgi:hypothetical protein